MAERFGLVPTKGAVLEVVSIKPGGMSNQVAFQRAHLVVAASHKLPQAHEQVWCEAKGIGVVVRERERTPVVYHECLHSQLQGTVGVGHDFITRQGGEVGEEGRVDEWSKRKVLEERNTGSKMYQRVHWKMGTHWGRGERRFPVERHDVGS